MKIEILQANIAKGINSVSRIVGNRTTLPVLANVLIKADKNKIFISATNLEVAVTTQVKGKVISQGEITIPSRLFSDYVLNNTDEKITLDLKDLTLSFKSNRFEANIKGISAEEFPTIPKISSNNTINIKSDDLSKGLRKVVLAAANDDTRPVLAGVYMKFDKKTLVMAATDSYRLSEVKLNLDKEMPKREIIVPARTLNEILRIIGTNEEVKEIEIISEENQVAFIVGETQVVSRLIEGSFPNYSQIIPQKSKIIVNSDLGETLLAIKMSALFAKDLANNIKLQVKKDQLVIKSTAEQAGDTTSKVPANVSGGELEIAFNARYIMDILGVLEDKKIIMEFNDDASPGVIKSKKNEDFLYLIMPLKIDA